MKPRSLFSAFGIEIEYMLVDRDSGRVAPWVDLLLRDPEGRPVAERRFGEAVFSNELAAHVLEIKTPGPMADWMEIEDLLVDGLKLADRELGLRTEGKGAILPGAMHPLMVPAEEGRLWPHEGLEIYQYYDRVFDCRRHGWMNLQSIHLNLPFADDEEFGRLHAACRLLLPLLPALTSASPFCQGEETGWESTRLKFYADNQQKFPTITGSIVPEAIFNQAEYEEAIYRPMMAEVGPINSEGILEPEWLNSRGAIARFDRMAIEIRVVDAQESVRANLALAAQIVALAQHLAVARGDEVLAAARKFATADLREQFLTAARYGREAPLLAREWGHFLSEGRAASTLGNLWRRLREDLGVRPQEACLEAVVADRLGNGLLAERMRRDRVRLDWPEILAKGIRCQRENCLWT